MSCVKDNFSCSADKTQIKFTVTEAVVLQPSLTGLTPMLPYGWAHCCSQERFCTLCVSALANMQLS